MSGAFQKGCDFTETSNFNTHNIGRSSIVVDGGIMRLQQVQKRKWDSERQKQQRHKQVKKRKLAKIEKLFSEETFTNPLQFLNELKPGLKFNDMGNMSINPGKYEFQFCVTLAGQEYDGYGVNKKAAKQDCALKALAGIRQRMVQDEDGDESMETGDIMKELTTSTLKSPTVEQKQKIKEDLMTDGSLLHPLSIVHRYHPGLKFELLAQSGVSPDRTFTMGCIINNKNFQGTGSSKKIAKIRCAQQVLKELHGTTIEWGSSHTAIELPSTHLHLPTYLPDQCARIINRKFDELTTFVSKAGKSTLSNYARRKVLAGIVMTIGSDLDDAKIITIASGTKCISGERLSNEGATIIDCHAEILARRSLIRFFHSQLILCCDPATYPQSIFEKKPNEKLYRIKEHIQFHLYISSAPCGDSRIFAPHESHDTSEADAHPGRKARGQCRTKVESGEGTLPLKDEKFQQTWDGILAGERLLTMSCSDKICRWNLCGVQGALLSLVIEPVYFDSVICGSFFHLDHMNRAIISRIGTIGTLDTIPLPYRINSPYLSGINNPESRSTCKAPNHAINWCVGDTEIEVILAASGRLENSAPSRLCKRALFEEFYMIYQWLPGFGDKLDTTYNRVKSKAIAYQQTKEVFNNALIKQKLGYWCRKPSELDGFSITVPQPNVQQLQSVRDLSTISSVAEKNVITSEVDTDMREKPIASGGKSLVQSLLKK